MDASALRFLVVDDSELMRKVIRDVLSRLGLDDVDEAVDGVDALRLCRLTRYDLVVTDLSMPRLNGIDLLRAIRVMPGREHTAVLLASCFLSKRDIREARSAGVDGFLPKPFIEAPLTEQVTAVLERLRRVSYVLELGRGASVDRRAEPLLAAASAGR
jgi:two-component system chemotaxis response regulator CheY